MTAKIILNPYANRWKALRRRDELVQALTQANLDFDLTATAQPRQAIEIAYEAVQAGFRPIVAAGGDGTFGEVMEGVFCAAFDQARARQRPVIGLDADWDTPLPELELTPVGLMPLGSANDLADNVHLPHDLAAAARVIATGRVHQLDLCQVRWKEADNSRPAALAASPWKAKVFSNNSAIGLEPFITLKQQKITRIHGVLRYLLATLQGVAARPVWDMHLAWDGGESNGPTTMVTVGNFPRTGGLFYVTPHALGDDGRLTFVYGHLPTRRQILRILPRLMRPGPGNYVEHPAVHERHSAWLRVLSQQPTPLHADGEIQSQAARQIEFRSLPGLLPLLLPDEPKPSQATSTPENRENSA